MGATRALLVLAEGAVRAATTHAAAGTARGTRRRVSVVAGPFGDGAGASTDETLDVSATVGTGFDGGIRHFLPFLEPAGTGFALVFVGGHGMSGFIVEGRSSCGPAIPI